MSETGRVALVTGASRGIGRAIALRLAASGHAVAVNYARSSEAAQAVVERIQAAGGRAQAVRADVSSPEEVAKMLETVQRELGDVDILVNNAGVIRDTLLLRMKDEDWNRVVEINLDGVFNCTRACLRAMMKRRWGRIVNITSVVALVGSPGQANYCAAKAGILGFTKAVAREVASRGITVNAVAPGLIETDMTGQMSAKRRDQVLQGIPMGRIGTGEDVAALVDFLVSEAAGYITGQTIAVDGGMTML